MSQEHESRKNSLAELFPVKDLLMSTDGAFIVSSETDIELHGVTVFAEFTAEAEPDPVITELLKRARERTDKTGKVTLVLTGDGITAASRVFFSYGADRIFIYDDPALRAPASDQYKAVFSHFLENYKPDVILGTNNEAGKALLGCLVGAQIDFPGKPLRISAGITPDPSRRGELVICKP